MQVDKPLIGKILFVLVLAILFLFIYYVFIAVPDNYNNNNDKHEDMITISKIDNATYSRSNCDYKISETLKKVLEANNIKNVKSNGNVHFVCGYDEIDNEINKINPQPDQRIHIIHNADHISAKDYLWNRLVISSGLERAKIMMPNTYILSNNDDRIRLENEWVQILCALWKNELNSSQIN